VRRESSLALFLGLLGIAAVAAVAGIPLGAFLLIGFAVVTPLERWRPRRNQPILRRALTADVAHVLFSFPLIFLLSLAPTYLVQQYVPDPPTLIDSLTEVPLALQIIVGVVAVDLIEYWVHRAFHEIPFLWRFHQVHHSIETMDWVAGGYRRGRSVGVDSVCQRGADSHEP